MSFLSTASIAFRGIYQSKSIDTIPATSRSLVPVRLTWADYGPDYNVEIILPPDRSQNAVDSIRGIYINNTDGGTTAIKILFPDTNFVILMPQPASAERNRTMQNFVLTNGLRFTVFSEYKAGNLPPAGAFTDLIVTNFPLSPMFVSTFT